MSIRIPEEPTSRVAVLASSVLALLPPEFPLAADEQQKVARFADVLHCPVDVAKGALLFLLAYVGAYRREIPVAGLPAILARFPIKWGYRKKRHDVLKALQDMDFIFVKTDYWAKVRAKKYSLRPAGQELLRRALDSVFRLA